jgi:hypothetical protein
MKLTTHLHVVTILKCMELYLHSSMHLHDVVLRESSRDNFSFSLPGQGSVACSCEYGNELTVSITAGEFLD